LTEERPLIVGGDFAALLRNAENWAERAPDAGKLSDASDSKIGRNSADQAQKFFRVIPKSRTAPSISEHFQRHRDLQAE